LSVSLAVVAHDPRNELLGKLEKNLPALRDAFTGIGVMASVDATGEALSLFRAHDAVVRHEDRPACVPTIGRRRRGALAAALETGNSHILFSDLDHVMRWLERDPDDLAAALAVLPDADFTVIGRTPEVFAEAPAPLRETERLCNAYYERLTGRAWELFIAVRGMSAGTAELIVDGCDEDTIATDVAWPLFVESQGSSLAYREARLHYENHRWYASGVSERERIEADPRAWAFRMELGRQMFEAFARWGPS
jgi:hypothetical protein